MLDPWAGITLLLLFYISTLVLSGTFPEYRLICMIKRGGKKRQKQKRLAGIYYMMAFHFVLDRALPAGLYLWLGAIFFNIMLLKFLMCLTKTSIPI